MRYDLITIVASRRGVIALRHLLAELPSTFSAPIACLVEAHAGLARELQAGSRLKVVWAERGMRVEKGHVYLSKPGESLVCMPGGVFGIAPFGAESSAMNPVDAFLESAAQAFGRRTLSLVLSGFDHDGIAGCDRVKRAGGTVLVLDRATARYWGLAEPIVQAGAADRVLTIVEVAEALRGCFTSQDLLRCAEIQVRLGEMLEEAMRISGTRMGHVTRRMPDTDKLRIVVQRGLGLDFFEHFEAIPTEGQTAWCRAVRCKHRVLVPDVLSEPAHPGHGLPRLVWRSELSTPLLLPRDQIEANGAITTLFDHAHPALGPQLPDLDRLAAEAAALVAQVP
jgi:two-component system chemotaxis response regulator CheB